MDFSTVHQATPLIAWVVAQGLKTCAPSLPKRVRPFVALVAGTIIGVLSQSPDAAQSTLDTTLSALTAGAAGVGVHELGEGVFGRRKPR